MNDSANKKTWLSIVLLVARVVAGGALVSASLFKMQGGPLPFALAIESFALTPQWAIVPLAYLFPMLEFVLGAALLLGAWTRQAAFLSTLVYIAFTFALASVLLRDMDVDCGCFGGIFGESTVTWFSIFRNTIFIVASAIPVWFGGGRFSIEEKLTFDNNTSSPAPNAEPESG